MIPRYTRPKMGAIWTDENRFGKMLEVEIAAAEAEADAKLIPRAAARAIKQKGRINVESGKLRCRSSSYHKTWFKKGA